jgi:hypothetical protein
MLVRRAAKRLCVKPRLNFREDGSPIVETRKGEWGARARRVHGEPTQAPRTPRLTFCTYAPLVGRQDQHLSWSRLAQAAVLLDRTHQGLRPCPDPRHL